MNDIDKDFMREEYTEKVVCDIKKILMWESFLLMKKIKHMIMPLRQIDSMKSV